METIKFGDKSEAVGRVQYLVGAVPDGDFGPKTDAAIKRWLRQEALRVAITQIGVHEQPPGSNWGPEVSQYLRSVGLNEAEPWCASFTHYCYLQAANRLGVANPHPKSGYCPTVYKGLTATNNPQPGDLFFVYSASMGRLSHVGFVKSVAGGMVATVEGNSNSNGSRDGEAVVSHSRNMSGLRFATIISN